MESVPRAKLDAWLAAAGKRENVGKAVLERIVVAARFIELSARIAASAELLRGIDFSKPVQVVGALPDKVYVQYAGAHRGRWFTDTGLTPGRVGVAAGKRTRKLYKPRGSVAALRCTASSIKDTWTPDRLFQSVDPKTGRGGEATQGGGVQYLVADVSRMQEV